ncbi:MAG: S41 family peptidase [Thomasclavelia sp.]|jgi:carboxyl-terminal processing protease|nr:S41 family peptidase [Thomasclavelia sp.]
MDDFIRPNREPEKPKKKLNKNILIIIGMVICIIIGYLLGTFVTNNASTVTNNNSNVTQEVYEILKNNWVNTTGEKVDLTKSSSKGMVNSLGDSHSEYLTSEEASEFNESVDGNYKGIGVTFGTISAGAIVTKVADNSPASKAGIEIGDIITKADDNSLAGLTSEKIKEKIRGDEGTTIKLTLSREGKNIEVNCSRASVSTAVKYEIRESNKIKFGYIEITTFGSTTGTEVKAALKKFKENNVDNLVIDLRDNGGGYVSAASDLLNLFLTSDQIEYRYQEKSGPEKVIKADSDDNYEFSNGYILVNENTASASEMTAGTLQQTLKYKLIGTQTYGKGSMQTQKTLSDGSVLKYTFAKWSLPDGTSINSKGLTPDVKIENTSLDGISGKEVKKTYSIDQVSNRIKDMQKMLNILGYNCGREDGYFSEGTANALKQFETAKGLTVDGQYTESDRVVILSSIYKYIANSDNDNQYKKLLELIK